MPLTKQQLLIPRVLCIGGKEGEPNWADIKGFEGLYQVSNFGVVRGLERTIKRGFKGVAYTAIKKQMILKPNKRKDGYNTVQLSKNDKSYTFYIHRLVAASFLAPVQGKDFINHIDCNKSNNVATNLEYCTVKENISHSIKNKLQDFICGENHCNSKLKESDIRYIRSSNESSKALGDKFNVTSSYINDIKRKRSWKHVI